MNIRITTFVASTTLAILATNSFGSDTKGHLGSDRDNASIQTAQTEGVQVKVFRKAHEPTFMGNRTQARRSGESAEYDSDADRDNADSPPQALESLVKYGFAGNTLMMAGEFQVPDEERPGRCGTDDYDWDFDEHQTQNARFTIQIPLEFKSDRSSKTYLTVNRPYLALGLIGETEGSSPEIVGSIFGGKDGRVEICTFSYSEKEYVFISGPRVPLAKVAGNPVYLSLDGVNGVGFYGDMDFEGAFQLKNDRSHKVQNLNFSQWETAPDEEAEGWDIFGDLNGDGLVNQGDFAALISAWGTEEGDLDGDGTTDGQDLGLLVQKFDSCWG